MSFEISCNLIFHIIVIIVTKVIMAIMLKVFIKDRCVLKKWLYIYIIGHHHVKYRLRGAFYCPKKGKKVPIKGTRLFTGVRLFFSNKKSDSTASGCEMRRRRLFYWSHSSKKTPSPHLTARSTHH